MRAGTELDLRGRLDKGGGIGSVRGGERRGERSAEPQEVLTAVRTRQSSGVR